MEKAASQVVEAAPRCDGAQVGEATRLLEHVTRSGERSLQEWLAGHGPDVPSVRQEPSPVLTCGATECRVEGGTCTRPVVGHVELGAVGEAVVRNGIDLDEVDTLLECGTGLEKGVPPDRGQGQQRRAGVEREAVPLVSADLPAERRRLFADQD